MIANFYSSVLRVTILWYVGGALLLFLGLPEWAEKRYLALTFLPWLPEIALDGLSTAANVQWTLVLHWTLPVFVIWAVSLAVGVCIVEIQYRQAVKGRILFLKPRGAFWGVNVYDYSLGELPKPTTPSLRGRKVAFDTPGAVHGKHVARVKVDGPVKEALKMLTPTERSLCEELLQLLKSDPEHFAGMGHGVGLLEHTLNVVVEAAPKCTPEFRLPLVAALAHDIGKLITFKPDGKGGWVRRGLHSRESARILATLPSFLELPVLHQRGLILAVKYDHAPSKMPELRGDRDASMLAMRIISALSAADKTATAGEKQRNLEKLQPEDLLWKDFVDFLRNAPVVERGKKGAANQVNNPPDSEYLFVYEAQWREAAIMRLPPEVAAALDLTRRDAGKLAKYTQILADRLRKEGLLVEEHSAVVDGAHQVLKTTRTNPLWDIQSGNGAKALVMRGILVLHAEALWHKVNYKLGIKSPFPVAIIAPTANLDGRVNQAPQAKKEAPPVEASEGMKVNDMSSPDMLSSLGLVTPGTAAGTAPKMKSRARGTFRPPESDKPVPGLAPAGSMPKPKTPVSVEVAKPASPDPVAAVLDAEAEPETDELTAALAQMQWEDPTAAQDDSIAIELDEAQASSTASVLDFLLASGSIPAVEANPEDEAPTQVHEPGISEVTPDAAPEHSPEPAVKPAEDIEQLKAAAMAARVMQKPAAPTQAPKAPAAPAKPNSTPGLGFGTSPKRRSPAAQAKPTVTKPTAPATATSKPVAPKVEAPVQAPAGIALDLSRAEKREGLGIADAATVALYPHLVVGDKFYTEESTAVQSGLRPAGTKYKGDSKDRKQDQTEGSARRKTTRGA